MLNQCTKLLITTILKETKYCFYCRHTSVKLREHVSHIMLVFLWRLICLETVDRTYLLYTFRYMYQFDNIIIKKNIKTKYNI